MQRNAPDINALAKKNKSVIGILLFMMIASYFSISESAAITQVFKMSFRFIALIWCFLTYQFNLKKGMVASYLYKARLALWLYLAYLVLSFASFMWITEGPERSAKVSYSILQWNMTVQSLIFVYYYYKLILQHNYFYREFNINISILSAQVMGIICLIFLMGSFIEPDVFYRSMRGGSETRLGGYLMNPNELGMLASMGASLALLELLKSKKKGQLIFWFTISLLTLLLTTSRSSVIGFLIIAMLILKNRASIKIKVIAFILAGIGIPFILQYVIFKAGNVEEVFSMTGRIPFWTALLQEGIVKEPFLGYGFQRISYTNRFISLTAYSGHMTHNTFMQVLMNLGFIGFLLIILQMTLLFRGIIQSKNKDQKAFFLAMIVPLFINSVTEFGIFGQTNYAIFFYQLLIFVVVQHYNPKLNQQEKLKANLFFKKFKAK